MTPAPTRWIAKKRHSIPLATLALGVVFATIATLSPWPAALVIRALFESEAKKTVAEMQPHVPAEGVDARLDVTYGVRGADTTLDVFSPSGSRKPLPTVVWIHGGAWISGSKENVDPYLRILAAHGYTTVGLNYTVAPEATYPVALTQLNDALAFLVAHAADYGIDPDRIILAGDSAGAQYASQLATMITSPVYAEKVGITPALTPGQLRAVILNCGIYDVSGIPDAPGLGGWGFRVALWSYLGTKDWSNTAGGELMSTLDDVTGDFPRTWITGGNGDPLTAAQSKPFAAKLSGLGVPVTEVFYADDHVPSLPHEYQFHLDGVDAQAALTSMESFLDGLAVPSPRSAPQVFPAGSRVDYQLGGGYPPPPGVSVVTRDSLEPPAPGLYSICYVNGFQTQPKADWPDESVLRDASGARLVDPNWPDENIIDISTARKRADAEARIDAVTDRCAVAGFAAVEFDNLDSYTRSQGALTLDDAVAFATGLIAHAHGLGLAVGQKNTGELGARGRDDIGFDFAVVEGCDQFNECAAFVALYGERVIDIEYSDDLRRPFTEVCADRTTPWSTILRDRALSMVGGRDYVYQSC